MAQRDWVAPSVCQLCVAEKDTGPHRRSRVHRWTYCEERTTIKRNEGNHMAFNRSFSIAAVALFAIAASFPAPARELHNLVLLVPESLPAASVEESSAPT